MDQTKDVLFNQKIRAKFYEYNYLINQYPPKSPQEKQLIGNSSTLFLKYQFSGLFFAAFAALSYRRYTTNTLSVMYKMPIDLSLAMISLVVFSRIGVGSAMDQLFELRKHILLKSDKDYLGFLVDKYNLFPTYQEDEYFIYSGVLSPEEFQEWKAKTGFNIHSFKR